MAVARTLWSRRRFQAALAGCAGAPMMVINGHYHERLTLDKVDELLDGLE